MTGRADSLVLASDPSCTPERAKVRRNKSFDVFRIAFALLVLLAHAAELTDGNKSRELLARLTHTPITFGILAVDGFFLLSGFLISRSWDQHPRLSTFLRNRLLRIVPGYLVAVVLSTVAVGMLAPGVPNFFHHFTRAFVSSVLGLSYPKTPPVFPGAPYPSANGALWTINYEFRCYLLVALGGLCGFLRSRTIWLGATALLWLGFLLSGVTNALLWPPHLVLLFGDAFQDYRLVSTYFIGVCFYLFREHIRFTRPMAAAAWGALLLSPILIPRFFEQVLVLAGAYLLFYAGQAHGGFFSSKSNFPDVSYGVYVYGWPVESLLIWFHHGSPWITFVEAALLCIPLGWLSWHFVERPMLALKTKTTAPLPEP